VDLCGTGRHHFDVELELISTTRTSTQLNVDGSGSKLNLLPIIYFVAAVLVHDEDTIKLWFRAVLATRISSQKNQINMVDATAVIENQKTNNDNKGVSRNK